MRKELGRIIVLVSVVVFCLGATGVAAMLEVDIGADEITMKSKEARKPAVFPHRTHQDMYSCTQCHHVKDQVMTIANCERCHNEKMGNIQLNSLKNAGHALCRTCHKNVNSKEGVEAPTRCGSCHPA